MPKKILILGGARFHGLQLVERLSSAGEEVYVLNRGRCKTQYDQGIIHLIANRDDLVQLKHVFENLSFDAVIDNNAYNPRQVEKTLALLFGRYDHYILTSTTAVYLSLSSDHNLREDEATGVVSGPYSPKVKKYALDKFAAEEFLRRNCSDINYTIIRLPNVFGVGDFVGKLSFFYHRFQDEKKMLLEEEINRFNLVWVKDVVKVLCAVINNELCFGKTINVADPTTFNYDNFFSSLFGDLYSNSEIVLMPAQKMWNAGYFLPLAWGPMVDTTLLQSIFGNINFTPLDIWGEEALGWELEHFGNRLSDPNFASARELELKLINREMSYH